MSLLAIGTAATVGICVGVAAFTFFVALLVIRRTKREKKIEKSTKINGQFVHLELEEKYMPRKQLKFLYLLNKILPGKYIAFCNVGVDKLCKPLGNRIEYNKILSKYVDFVIFEEATMKPRLVVDVYDMSYGNESIQECEPDVTKALEAIKLPMIQFMIKNEYNEKDIKDKIMTILEPPQKEESKAEEKKQ